jgi:hypothetical protein
MKAYFYLVFGRSVSYDAVLENDRENGGDDESGIEGVRSSVK